MKTAVYHCNLSIIWCLNFLRRTACVWHKLAAATLLHKLITLKLVNCMWPKFGAIKYAFLLLYHGSSCIPLIVYRLHQFIVGTGCILIYLIVMNTICSLCHSLYMYNWTKPVNIRDIPWTAPASILVYWVFFDCILSEKTCTFYSVCIKLCYT